MNNFIIMIHTTENFTIDIILAKCLIAHIFEKIFWSYSITMINEGLLL